MDEEVQRAKQVLARRGIDPVGAIFLAPLEIQRALHTIWQHQVGRTVFTWTSQDRRQTPLSGLTDSHLLNILGCYDRGEDANKKKFHPKCGNYKQLVHEAYYRNLTYIGFIKEDPIINPWELVIDYAM